MTFKAGDKVKCIDNEHVEEWFSPNEIYIITVAYRDGEHVCFAHTGVSLWHSWRFELVENGLFSKEDILNAWVDFGWSNEALEIFMKSLNKVTSSEYKEYLRLKAVFEQENE